MYVCLSVSPLVRYCQPYPYYIAGACFCDVTFWGLGAVCRTHRPSILKLFIPRVILKLLIYKTKQTPKCQTSVWSVTTHTCFFLSFRSSGIWDKIYNLLVYNRYIHSIITYSIQQVNSVCSVVNKRHTTVYNHYTYIIWIYAVDVKSKWMVKILYSPCLCSVLCIQTASVTFDPLSIMSLYYLPGSLGKSWLHSKTAFFLGCDAA